MHVPEWLATPLDMKIDNKVYDSDLEDDLIETHVHPEAKALSKRKKLSEHWSNINVSTEWPKLRAAAELFLITFPTSYMAQAGPNTLNAIKEKQWNRLNQQNRGDLRLKITNLQTNISNYTAAHLAHPSH